MDTGDVDVKGPDQKGSRGYKKPSDQLRSDNKSKWSRFMRFWRYLIDGFDTTWMLKDVTQKRHR